jgi:hypothetical protein
MSMLAMGAVISRDIQVIITVLTFAVMAFGVIPKFWRRKRQSPRL